MDHVSGGAIYLLLATGPPVTVLLVMVLPVTVLRATVVVLVNLQLVQQAPVD